MNDETVFRLDEMNWKTIFHDILFHFPYILLAVLTVLMGVGIYKNVAYVPEYTSKATMAVMAKGNADGSAYSSLTTANSMAEVFTEVFQSDIIKEKVKEDLGELPAGLKISSSLIPETNLLELKVTALNPQSSFRVMQSILANYRYVSDYLFGNAVLEVIEDPMVPMSPSNVLNVSKFQKLGVLGVVVLLCGLIGFLSILRRTVKTRKSALRNLEGKCLGCIPYEVKNKTLQSKINKTNKAILMNQQVVHFAYEESIQHLASNLEFVLEQKEKKCVLVTSVAENEGKSTICVNLAMALAKRHKKVLLMDVDFRKPAIYKLLSKDLKVDFNLSSYLMNQDMVTLPIEYDEKNKFYVIGNKGLEDVSIKALDTSRFVDLLAQVQSQFDYVILDSVPISVGVDTEYVRDFVDTSLLVVRQDVVEISDLNDAMEMMCEGSTQFLGYVLNAFDQPEIKHTYGYGYEYGYGK